MYSRFYLVPVEDDGVHVGPSLELSLPVRHGGQGSDHQERSPLSVVIVQDGQKSDGLYNKAKGREGNTQGEGEERRVTDRRG